MADLGATVFVGGTPAAGGGPSTADNRFELDHAPSPTVHVGGGSTSTSDNRFEAVEQGGADIAGDAPEIINFVPAVGSTLGVSQTVQFELVDDHGIKRGMVIVAMGGVHLVVHDGDTFMPGFNGSRVPITIPKNGFRFRVNANAGWKPGNPPAGGPVFRYLVTDAAGQEAT